MARFGYPQYWLFCLPYDTFCLKGENNQTPIHRATNPRQDGPP
jgi:hypothetical protein